MPALIPQGTPTWQHTSTPVFPTGYTPIAGHLAIVAVWAFGGSATNATPSGWFKPPSQNGALLAVYAKKLVGGDVLPPFPWTGSPGQTKSICFVVGGDVASDITTMFEIAASRVSNSTQNIPYPALAVSGVNDFLIAVGYRHKTAAADGETVNNLAGFTPALAADVPNGNSQIVGTFNYVQQGAAASLGTAAQTTTKADTNDACLGYVLAIKTQVVASAGFSAGPVVNSVTAIPSGSYTLGFTGSAAGTFYVVAIMGGAPAPSAAQVVLGQDSFGVAALAAANKAVTGADTVVLGGSLASPIYDLYCVFRTTVNSAVSALLGQFLLPTAGKQFAVVSGPPAPGTDSILIGVTPAAASPDVIECDQTTTPGGFALAMSSTGLPEYVGTGAPQSFVARVFDYSNGVWSAPVTEFVNNLPPIYVGGVGPLFFALNATIAPVGLLSTFQGQNGNTLSIVAVSGLPPGIFVSGNQLVGAGTVQGIYTCIIQANDPAGVSAIGSFTIVVGDVQLPTDLAGETQATGTNELQMLLFVVNPVSVPSALPVGSIIDSSPSPGSFAPGGSTVILSIAVPLPIVPPPPPPPPPPPDTPPPPPVTIPIPPIQNPGQIVSRSGSIDLTLNDLFQYWGDDLNTSNTQDLLAVSGPIMGRQRVLRRLLTNQGDYLFNPTYGAGLPAYVGQTTDVAKITALILSQMLLESVVAPSPPPVITVGPATVTTDATALQVSIEYTDAPSGEPQTLSFSLSK